MMWENKTECKMLSGKVLHNKITVFPACAGMFRTVCQMALETGGFPRVRGDVPASRKDMPLDQWFSPRARGCSYFRACCEILGRVFPACAGMFHWFPDHPISARRFPRVRGDVPPTFTPATKVNGFSPRARGCSVFHEWVNSMSSVFPACAGMFPRR